MTGEENSKAIININNTSYNIQNDWFETMRKYFNIDANNAEAIHFLKAGLFGYNNEIFANEIKNNVYHRNIIYDEHFLNTASFPESIFNFAKTFNYTIDMARPSQCRVNFAIRKDDLVNNKFRKEVVTDSGEILSNRKTFELTLTNDFTFMMDNIQFRMPYPVKILFKETEDKTDFSLIATYDTELDFPYMDLANNSYIKLWQDYVNGERIVFLGLDLFQVQKLVSEFDIVSEDITDNLFYDVNFSQQLCHFNVFYEYNGKKELLKTYFNNTFQPKDDEKFCYYSLIDDETLQLTFSSASSSFRPRLNSKITVETFVTSGTGGNFSFIGNTINVGFTNGGEFDKVTVNVIPITECEGGLDKPSYTQVKNGIINNFAVRNNLIIDNDLEVFFKHVDETEDLNDSTIEFIKKRNDVIKRLFNAYLIIRDKNKKVIPTNTAPVLCVSKPYLIKNNFCIKENTDIVYLKNENTYMALDDIKENSTLTESELEALLQDNHLLYSCPFILKVNEEPLLNGNYYSSFIDKNFDMKYTYINERLSESFQIKELTIKKNNITDTKYTISLNLNTTYNINETNNIKVRCIVMDENNKPYGFMDLECPDLANFYYEGYLETDGAIHDNKMIILDSLYNVKGSAIGSDILQEVLMSENIKIELALLIKNKDTNFKYGNFKYMKDLDEYTTAVVYTNEDIVPIFKNLYNYMESDVSVYPAQSGNVINITEPLFSIKQFPLVENVYFKHSFSNFFNVWEVYLKIIKENIDKLENNTSVDIKLTNTYGPSRFYYYDTYLDDYQNIAYKYIDNVHMGLNLIIHLNYYMDMDTNLAIKKFISDFIENCNNERLLPISNLIRMLENKFEIIKYIEFFEIGNHDTQKIRSSFTSLLDMSKEEVDAYVPEYMNVEKELDLSTPIDNNLLDYPYNYKINITYK